MVGALTATPFDDGSSGWGFTIVEATIPNGGSGYDHNQGVGIALFDPSNTLIEFICFEAEITDTDLGRTCNLTNVHHASSSHPRYWTLQRVGSSDVWHGPVPDASWGFLNALSPANPPEGLCAGIQPPSPAPVEEVARINELHYNSIAGSGRLQYLEIRSECPGLRLDGWQVVAYDYNSKKVTYFVTLYGATQPDAAPSTGFGYHVVQLGSAGINTLYAAVALVDAAGLCRDFWAYGSTIYTTFQALDGPCVGYRPALVGVAESSATAETDSLQRLTYTSWQSPLPNTKGAANLGSAEESDCPAGHSPTTTTPEPVTPDTPRVVISEVHYDDRLNGGALTEMVELRGCPGLNLTNYKLQGAFSFGGLMRLWGCMAGWFVVQQLTCSCVPVLPP